MCEMCRMSKTCNVGRLRKRSDPLRTTEEVWAEEKALMQMITDATPGLTAKRFNDLTEQLAHDPRFKEFLYIMLRPMLRVLREREPTLLLSTFNPSMNQMQRPQ